MAPRYCLIVLLPLLLLTASLGAQLRVEVYRVPDYTPVTDSLYLAGSVNDWASADPRFRLARQPDGRYTYDFLTPVPDFEFKITRGDWDRVEGGPFGGPVDNRRYVHGGDLRDTIRLEIASWEDMADRIAFLDTLTLIVEEVPENTPEDATLYVTGNFNDWSPRDQDYRMQRTADGQFRATIPLRVLRTDFKITRGSWASSESRENGMALPNRSFRWTADGTNILRIRIANWEDLAGSPLGWYGMVLLLFALQAAILAVVVLGLDRRNRLLAALLALLGIGMAARVGAFDRTIFQAVPKLILLPDLLFVLPAPLCYLLLRRRTGGGGVRPADGYHLLPAALLLLAYLPLLLTDREGFTTRVVVGDLRTYAWPAAALGWGLAVGYWWWTGRLRPLTDFGRRLRASLLPVLLLWGATVLTGGAYLLGLLPAATPTEWLADLTWLLLGGVPLTVGYWLIRRPDRFRGEEETNAPLLPARHPASSPVAESASESSTVMSAAAPAPAAALAPLTELMRERRPYLNPKLTLAELADLAGMPAHQLSRLLNEAAGQSFFDFVNGYRVDHFTDRLRAGAHRERTMLSLALEAGFNSKSAFNRAFKKKQGRTPRQYLRDLG